MKNTNEEWLKVGVSRYTPLKQAYFERIIDCLLTIAIGATRKESNNSWLARNYVEVIDCNAGVGKYADLDGNPLSGSPILLKKRLESGNAGYKEGMRYSLALIEKDPRQALELEFNLPPSTMNLFDLMDCDLPKDAETKVFTGSNNELLPTDVRSWLLSRRYRLGIEKRLKVLGLIYSDPNGVNDCPWQALSTLSHDDSFCRHDILIYPNCTAIKKRRTALVQYRDTDLRDYFEGINKNYWQIGELKGCWQQAFLLGTNTPVVPRFRDLGFVQLFEKGKGFTREGLARFQEANYTKDELKQLTHEV